LSKIKIGGVVKNIDLALFHLESGSSQANATAELLSAFGKANINLQFIVQCQDEGDRELVVFCTGQKDQDAARDLIRAVQAHHEVNLIKIDPHMACIGIYGPDFRIRSGLGGTFLGILRASGIAVQAISTSMSTFSVVIPQDQLKPALTAIDQVFELP
jgi:aspartokinase